MSSYVGQFLVARPVLQDPNFQQSVVLLLQHGPEGAFGLVVNRPATAQGVPFPVYVGGPCKSQGLMMLHGHPEWLDGDSDSSQGVAPGIFLGDAATLKRVTDAEPEDTYRFRVFTHYSGWGPGQLEGELASNAWTLVPANGAILFETPASELWERVVPPKLPQPSVN